MSEQKQNGQNQEAGKQYSTGELAKLCGVTVRTVQYYDKRGLLVPSQLTEGGRRLYSEEDVEKMKLLCCLRDTGLSLDNIRKILVEDNSDKVIRAIIDEHIADLRREIRQQEEQLKKAQALTSELKNTKSVSVESMQDIAYIMENKKELRKLRVMLIAVGIPLDIIEIGTLIYAIVTGKWIWFILGMIVVIIGSIWISKKYYNGVNYICPECHENFKPAFKEALWAAHTPKTRKLVCPKCGVKSYCVETYDITSKK